MPFASQTVVTASGSFSGYPDWLVALVGILVAIVVIWILAKLLQWALWLALVIGTVAVVVLAVLWLLS